MDNKVSSKKLVEAGTEKKEVRKQKVSASYTIGQFKNNIEKLKILGLVTEETLIKLEEARKEVIEEYVKRL